jgi:hypothetical protein
MAELDPKRAHYATELERQPFQTGTTLQNSHPNGVQPFGNCYSDADALRRAHMGGFSILSDELLVDVLSGFPARDLLALAQCSRWLYCFVNHDDVWRQKLLAIAADNGFDYSGTWKESYLKRCCHDSSSLSLTASHLPLRFSSVFSDYLFEPWVAHSLDLDPAWLQAESVARCSAGIDVQQFIAQYDKTRTPAILMGYTRQWPAFQHWSAAYLTSEYPDARLNAGAATLTFAQYFAYASQQHDERPLYVFDKMFVSKCPPMAHDYR